MTELEQATAPSPTALANHLAATQLIPYRGALTPQHFDSPQAETVAVLFGAAVHDLGWLRRIALHGEDRYRWLSGMVTNAVETLPDQTGAYNLVLNAQGRIQGDLDAWRDGESLEIEVTAEQSEALLAHFDKFIIMDDVELAAATDQSALGLTGPKADEILTNLGLTPLPEQMTYSQGTAAGIPVRLYRYCGAIVPHYTLWCAAEHTESLWQALQSAGANPVGAATLESLRIAEGIPAYGIDIQSRDLAQETAQTRALNFTKGCYLGQEIVERIRSRGQVHRHLRSLELNPATPAGLPTAGTELRLEGSPAEAKPAATLTSITTLDLADSQRHFAIAMVRAEAEIGNRPLTWPGGTARILTTPPKFTC
jgi:folate-binding protein YgfZ